MILVATLVPFEATEELPPVLCVLCGNGMLADAALNAALFLPLGAALSLVGWPPLRALALGAGLSLIVETAQFVIPGRDPSLSDLLFNTLGTALGIALARSAPTWWQPRPRLADILTIAGALGTTSVLAATGVLLGPSFPEDAYYGGWTPRFGHLEWYGGRVRHRRVAVAASALRLHRRLRRPGEDDRRTQRRVRARARSHPPPATVIGPPHHAYNAVS